HLELRPLLVFGQNIALLGGCETALRREAELIERRKLRRLLDAPLDIVLLFERAALRGDEAKHDALLALGQKSQRFEAAGALGVVFEKIAVEIDRAEKPLGDRLIAAFSHPGRPEVA